MKRETGVRVMRAGVLSALVACMVLRSSHAPQWAFIVAIGLGWASVLAGLVLYVAYADKP